MPMKRKESPIYERKKKNTQEQKTKRHTHRPITRTKRDWAKQKTNNIKNQSAQIERERFIRNIPLKTYNNR